MSSQRYSPEFKDEAVRQIVERGYTVAEVSERLGVSSHSLYKWVKAVQPDKTEQQTAGLVEAKSEVLRLRAQLRRTEEERDILEKGRAVLCKGVRVKYLFINDHGHKYGVATMCRVLRVSRSGFYQWLHKTLSNRAIEDLWLLAHIRASYAASGGVYGASRVFLDLREAGERCGKHRAARIMRIRKIQALRGYKAPRTIAGRPSIIAPNKLQREFKVEQPDVVWVTDITYTRIWQGWLYLAVVVDLYSRKVVGWSMKPTLARKLVLDALVMAVWRRRPKKRVMVHSDQGSQYISDDWLRFLKANNMEPSMSRRGNSLKKERIKKRIYKTRDLAKADVFDYIESF